ncbi:hypothetical protein OIU79_024854 [Salix purpurea]|uniref:Uncharacterized protein n=1 Tax=Salix purpurea TaxID=77065 RepID=A0A9Q0W3J8_SALPP|nr:hypothetical protein OIU79_024854 [Salix purpurea]
MTSFGMLFKANWKIWDRCSMGKRKPWEVSASQQRSSPGKQRTLVVPIITLRKIRGVMPHPITCPSQDYLAP